MLSQFRGALALAVNGGAFAKPNWLFWLDFAIYPVIVAVIVATDCRDLAWFAWATLGALSFTFVEYWMHRLALHAWLYQGQHERHHTHPREYVVFPIYYTPTIFLVAYLALPLAIFAGFTIGYVWFLVWHHILHHLDLNLLPASVRRYALWHLAHHHDESCNFGITVPVWDLVFRTYRRI